MADTWEGLKEEIASLMPNILQKYGEQVKNELRQAVKDTWYATGDTMYYQKTMDVLNSIEVKPVQSIGSNNWQVEIYFNPEQIHSVDNSGGFFPSHMNITDGLDNWNGISYSELIINWLENGEGSSIYSRNAEPVVQNEIDSLLSGNRYLNEFASLLSAATGCQCVVV